MALSKSKHGAGKEGRTVAQQAAIDHYIENGGVVQKAAEAAGYTSPQPFYYLLSQPEVQDEIRDRIAKLFLVRAPAAFQVLDKIMMDEEESTKYRLEAAKIMLALAGFRPGETPQKADSGMTQSDEELKARVKVLLDKLGIQAPTTIDG